MADTTHTDTDTGAGSPFPAEAVVDLDAVRENAATLVACARGAQVMAVVKADAYGHGLLPCARAALAGGATWLGVAQLSEALALRAGGVSAPVLSWLHAPGDDLAAAVAADVDLSVGARWALAAAARAARRLGRPARIHLKVDTGLARGGATLADWPDLLAAVAPLQAEGVVEVVGIWSHYAFADAPAHPTVRAQQERFAEAVAIAGRAGVRPAVRHLANSAATLTHAGAALELVRPGLALYGLSPVPEQGSPADFGLRPAMTLRARLALVKRVGAGQGVSYGHAYTTTEPTSLGLVPIGYADGVPRHASNTGPVLVAGRRRTVAGRVCMDQFVVDLGDTSAQAGDEVVLFGAGDRGEPTAQEWADAAGTIVYEIVTRVGGRVPRRYVEGGLR